MSKVGFESELASSDGVILFDGYCAFCRNVVGQLIQHSPGKRLLVCSTRSARGDAAARQIGGDPAYVFAFVSSAGISKGVDAYISILAEASSSPWVGKLLASAPRAISGSVYNWVATHRPFMSRILGRGSRTAIPPDRFVTGGD